MPEIIIKYEKPETLKILKGLAKYFDFTLSSAKVNAVNDVNIIAYNQVDDRLKDILVPGDPSIDITELKKIFSDRNIDAKQLRKEAWERKR